VTKFVSDLRQVGGFLRGVKHHQTNKQTNNIYSADIDRFSPGLLWKCICPNSFVRVYIACYLYGYVYRLKQCVWFYYLII